MTLIDQLVKPSVKELKPYEAVEPPPGVVELDANENLLVDERWAKEILLRAAQGVDPRSYPPAYGREAVKALSRHLAVDEKALAVNNGSDEFIDLVFKAFVSPGDEVVIVEPTFEIYGLMAKVAGAVVKRVLVDADFKLNVEGVLEATGQRTKLIFLCSPNNPTGVQYSPEEVRKVAEECRCLVVVDEAYVDFAEKTVMNLALELDNVLVLRSFSKTAGMAGLRIGYALASPHIIETLRKVDLPFRVSGVAQKALALALEEWNKVGLFLRKVKEERERLFNELSSINGLKPYPSQANFFLVRVVKEGFTSRRVYESLLRRGLLVRDRGHLPMLENCLRITVGTREVNRRLLEALREVMEAAQS